jgi:hypothetical protein
VDSSSVIPMSKSTRPRPSTTSTDKLKSDDGLFDPIPTSNTSSYLPSTSARGSFGISPATIAAPTTTSIGLFASREREPSKDLSNSYLPSSTIVDSKVFFQIFDNQDKILSGFSRFDYQAKTNSANVSGADMSLFSAPGGDNQPYTPSFLSSSIAQERRSRRKASQEGGSSKSLLDSSLTQGILDMFEA